MSRDYPLDAWYQAAWSHEIPERGMLARTLLETPVLVLRDDNGDVAAMLDRCPHRFAPLSRGRFDGSSVTCGYHGLSFDKSGQCVHNPHGRTVSHARVRAFPVIEKHDRIWIWFGEAGKADPALLPDLAAIDATPATSRSYHYMSMQANWMLIIDNLLDLSHADFIHPALGGFVTNATSTVEARPDGVRVRWIADNAEPPPVFKPWVPSGKAHIWLQADWVSPSFVLIDTGAVPAGTVPDRTMWSFHNITPETQTRSHYFFGFGRDFRVEDTDWTASMGELGEKAFLNEDKPMIEGQQERMGAASFFALDPTILGIDGAAILARRRLQKALETEAGAAE